MTTMPIRRALLALALALALPAAAQDVPLEPADAAETSAADAAAAYYGAVAESLSASASPLDRILALDYATLAAAAAGREPEPVDRARVEALAEAAGDDPQALALLIANAALDGLPDLRQRLVARLLELDPHGLVAQLQGIAAAGDDPALLTERIVDAASNTPLQGRSAASLDMYARLAERHPLPPALLAAAPGVSARLAGETAALALWTRDVPPLRPLMRACAATAVANDPTRDRACQTLGRSLFETGDTVIVQTVGFAVLRQLLADPDAVARLEAAMRRIEWQQEQVGALMADPARRENRLHAWFTAMRTPGTTESGNARAFLEREGAALDPPADWRSRRERDEQE
ncbi:hypothetical protein [Coralloluteibacterium stylophorae]|uniref:HEAT repeat domain-containing protein n=1 Tax=Coralloluteibacterium stylophorae TaxID=1776034 RepID=A0A8J7VQ66_9GAMM|nr:hypothetical protein [Coralloluteibacterium stylophorae]MBS7457336.1 hypothetical protein [Coralloluteibacterium stylophorae]